MNNTGFERFFKENQSLVMRIVMGYVRSKDKAEDITIEAFLKIYSKWDFIVEVENKTGYLVRTAINTAKTFLARDKFSGIFNIHDMEIKSDTKTPEDFCILNEENGIIEKELKALKEIERNIILLKDVERMKFDEIAAILSKKTPTIKSVYRRAKIKLSDRLEDNYENL